MTAAASHHRELKEAKVGWEVGAAPLVVMVEFVAVVETSVVKHELYLLGQYER